MAKRAGKNLVQEVLKDRKLTPSEKIHWMPRYNCRAGIPDEHQEQLQVLNSLSSLNGKWQYTDEINKVLQSYLCHQSHHLEIIVVDSPMCMCNGTGRCSACLTTRAALTSHLYMPISFKPTLDIMCGVCRLMGRGSTDLKFMVQYHMNCHHNLNSQLELKIMTCSSSIELCETQFYVLKEKGDWSETQRSCFQCLLNGEVEQLSVTKSVRNWTDCLIFETNTHDETQTTYVSWDDDMYKNTATTYQELHKETVRLREEWGTLLGSPTPVNSFTSDNSDLPKALDTSCFEKLSMVSAMCESTVGLLYISRHTPLLKDILSLLHTGSARVQRQVTSLLRRILPEIKPEVMANVVGAERLPPSDFSIISAASNAYLHSTEFDEHNVGILDVFLSCIAKSLTVQVKVKDKENNGKALQSISLATSIHPKSYAGARWWLRGCISRKIAEEIIQLLKDMASGKLSEAWAAITKAAIAENILNLTRVDDKNRDPTKCLRSPTLWLALSSLCVLDCDKVERLSSRKTSNSNSGLLAIGNVCSDHECQEHAKNACSKVHPCGHICGGVRDERPCLPCLHRCVPSCDLKQDADDMCMICFTEALSCAPAIQLQCGHVFHLHCCRTVLTKKWVGPRITFSFSLCPICKVPMDNPNLMEPLASVKVLYEDVKRKALMRLEYEGLHNAKAITDVGGRYYGDGITAALHFFIFYECRICKKAYHVGSIRSDVPLVAESCHPPELVCGGCSNVARAQMCPKHGTDFLEYKCRYCCSVAVFFCFGTTHFCKPCHDHFQRVTNIPKNELPTCPAGPKAKQLEGDECPLHVKHPPTGEEFALGCGICRNVLN